MKRLNITYCLIQLLTLLYLSNNKAFSQDTHSFGLKGGLTFSTLSNQEFSYVKPGLQIGGFAKIGGRESLFFKAELLATQAGSYNWNRSQPNNLSLYYFDLPLMFGINIYKELSINLGIQPSYLAISTLRSSQEGNIGTRAIGNNLTKFDYSYLFGLEYITRNNWLWGIRFNYGFVPIQKPNGILTFKNQNQLPTNRILQFYLGYVFR